MVSSAVIALCNLARAIGQLELDRSSLVNDFKYGEAAVDTRRTISFASSVDRILLQINPCSMCPAHLWWEAKRHAIQRWSFIRNPECCKY
jgi:hypothetical protein